MTQTTERARRTTEPSIEDAARRMASAGRPLGLGAWREVSRTGHLAGDADPDGTAAGLIRRWHQHLAVAIDLPMERRTPGEERLPELVTAWLDLARRTAPIRAHVARTSGPRAAAEAARQRSLLAGLLAEDLAALGATDPHRAARDLLTEMAAVAAAEDAAGRVLTGPRRTLVGGSEPAPRRRVRDRLSWRLRPATA